MEALFQTAGSKDMAAMRAASSNIYELNTKEGKICWILGG